MATTVTPDAFERAIKAAIERYIGEAIDREVEAACDRVRKAAMDARARIVLGVLKEYDVQRDMDRIVISVRDNTKD